MRLGPLASPRDGAPKRPWSVRERCHLIVGAFGRQCVLRRSTSHASYVPTCADDPIDRPKCGRKIPLHPLLGTTADGDHLRWLGQSCMPDVPTRKSGYQGAGDALAAILPGRKPVDWAGKVTENPGRRPCGPACPRFLLSGTFATLSSRPRGFRFVSTVACPHCDNSRITQPEMFVNRLVYRIYKIR